MIFQYSNLPTIIRMIEFAVMDQKKWIGVDASVERLAPSDLHFFYNYSDALNFVDFNTSKGKSISLLPAIISLDFIQEKMKNGATESIQLNEAELLDLHFQYQYALEYTRITVEMDKYDWRHIDYSPGHIIDAKDFNRVVQYKRLEFLIESMSVLAGKNDQMKQAVEQLLNRYWIGSPMEAQISKVLESDYHTNYFLSSINNNPMNMENLKFLQDNMKYTGFGESLCPDLEKNIQEKKPEFELPFSTQMGNRGFEATLQFRKSDTSDMYFFNRYVASIEKVKGEKIQQSFEIKKGKGITAKEAFNLLQGRAVKKEYTTDAGVNKHEWKQLNFEKKDKNGNFEVNRFDENYGYDLRQAVAKFPVQELDGGEKEKELMRSLERGNAQMATIDNKGEPMKIILEANPKYKTVNVYDEKFKMLKHHELPQAQKVEAPAKTEKQDTAQKVETSQQQGAKQNSKQTNGQKNDGVKMTKKRESKKKGVAVG